MPNHVRQQIRESAVTLVTGLSTTAGRVYESRVYDVETDKTPAIIVYTTTEVSERDTMVMGGNGIVRQVDLVIEGYAKGSSVDDKLDIIARDVEAALGADETLSGLAKSTTLISTVANLTGDGRSQAGVITLNFQVIYKTTQTTPDVAV